MKLPSKEFEAFEKRGKAYLLEDNRSEYANELLLMLSKYFFQKKRPEQAKTYLEKLVANQLQEVKNPEVDPLKRLELATRLGEEYNLLEDFQTGVIQVIFDQIEDFLKNTRNLNTKHW